MLMVLLMLILGNVTLSGTGRLRLSAAGSGVFSLGTLNAAAGTVEYDGGTQDVLADNYYNLEIDQQVQKQLRELLTLQEL